MRLDVTIMGTNKEVYEQLDINSETFELMRNSRVFFTTTGNSYAPVSYSIEFHPYSPVGTKTTEVVLLVQKLDK